MPLIVYTTDEFLLILFDESLFVLSARRCLLFVLFLLLRLRLHSGRFYRFGDFAHVCTVGNNGLLVFTWYFSPKFCCYSVWRMLCIPVAWTQIAWVAASRDGSGVGLPSIHAASIAASKLDGSA